MEARHVHNLPHCDWLRTSGSDRLHRRRVLLLGHLLLSTSAVVGHLLLLVCASLRLSGCSACLFSRYSWTGHFSTAARRGLGLPLLIFFISILCFLLLGVGLLRCFLPLRECWSAGACFFALSGCFSACFFRLDCSSLLDCCVPARWPTFAHRCLVFGACCLMCLALFVGPF